MLLNLFFLSQEQKCQRAQDEKHQKITHDPAVRVTDPAQEPPPSQREPAGGAPQTFTAKMAQQGFFIKYLVPAMRTFISLHKSRLLSHRRKNNQEKIL